MQAVRILPCRGYVLGSAERGLATLPPGDAGVASAWLGGQSDIPGRPRSGMSPRLPFAAGGGAMGVEYFTVEEVAERLRCSVSTIKRRCRDGTLPTVRIGKKWLIVAPALGQILKNHEST